MDRHPEKQRAADAVRSRGRCEEVDFTGKPRELALGNRDDTNQIQ
jgi:hypothetical protein